MKAGAEELGAWAEQIASASGGFDNPEDIAAALDAAAERIDPTRFAKLIEEALIRGAMLGALDSMLEREGDEADPMPQLASWRALMQNRGDGDQFVKLPFEDATRLFNERKLLPRPLFDQLSDAAKQKSFTVAGLATEELLGDAHAELSRQISYSKERTHFDEATGKWVYKGVDLRSFDKFARERLEKAGWTPANSSHVETVLRTNTMSAYSSGRHVEMTQPAVLKARPYWQITGVSDSRQRKTHRKAHGTILAADHPFWRKAYPPFGYNCFLPGTEVRGSFVGASRAWYSGKAIELTTAKGRRLSVTSNHPILTTSGFVAAKELCNGDDLLCYGADSGVGLLGSSSEWDKNHKPATVEQVFSALSKALPGEFTSAGSDDFHGEARFFNGDVEIVGSYLGLLRHGESAVPENGRELHLESPDATAGIRSAKRELIGSTGATASSGPRSSALPDNGVVVELDGLPLLKLSFGSSAKLDAVLTEDASHGLTSDSRLFSEILHRCAGDVLLDKVVNVSKFNFSGHVYDFQTVNGWLFAGDIASSNCRCRVVSRSKRWVDEHGGPTVVPDGLPDKGFASGIDASLVPEPIAVPSEGQREPTKAKAPHQIHRIQPSPIPHPVATAPTISEKPPEMWVAPVAPVPVRIQVVKAVEQGKHVRAVSIGKGVTKSTAKKTLEALHPDELKHLESYPLRELKLDLELLPAKGRKPSGCYSWTTTGSTDEIAIGMNRPASMYGDEFIPGKCWSMSATRKTGATSIEATFHHEFGHRLHVRATMAVDDIVRDAYANGNPITTYASDNRQEYFAESYAAYRIDPDALRTHDPVGYKMVTDVLAFWGIPLSHV